MTIAEGERIISISTAFNEETRIGDFLERFKKAGNVVDTILIVSDGSADKTVEIAKSYNVEVLSNEKRAGLGAAIKAGIKYALENNYSIIVFIAPNGKDNPQEIPNVLKPILEGKADYVQGSRYLDGNRSGGEIPFVRKFATRLHPALIKLTTGFPATDSTNGFRAMKTSIFKDSRINIWQKWLDTTSFEFYLYLMILKLDYKIVEAPVTKIYPRITEKFSFNKSGSMSKTKPITDWWRILKPLFYQMLGILK